MKCPVVENERGIAPPDFFELGRKLFAGESAFLGAAASAAELPPPGPPEIAFAGRSNVGKSSLLNALLGRKALARMSRTPGCTRELNFFALGGANGTKLRLVDMPGYGYTAAPKEKAASWASLIRDFLRGRAALLRVYLLIDGRRGVMPADLEMLDLLDHCAVSYQILLTKRDELNADEEEQRLASALALAGSRPAAFSEVIFTSSRTGDGIGDLRAAIARLLSERPG